MNWYPCVVCGTARYSHEVIAAPKLKSTPRITQWKQKVGETAVRRMLRYTQEAFICIDHFEYNQLFDEFGQVKSKWKPIETPEEERRVYETYFQDHGYFEIFRSDYARKIRPSLKTISCSLCSMNTERTDIESHAISHALIHFEDHVCEKHKMLAASSIQNTSNNSDCSECSYNQTKAAYELAKVCAEQCFRMFEFALVERNFAGETVFSLDYHIKDEYTANRPHWLDEDIMLSSKMMKQKKEDEVSELKLEPIDDYEQFQENAQQSEMALFQIDDGTPTKKKIKIEEEEYQETGMEATNAPSSSTPGDHNQQSTNHLDEFPIEFISRVYEISSKQTPGFNSELDPRNFNSFLDLFYQIKKHPTFQELNSLRELIRSTRSFRDIFQYFEKKRRLDKIVCPDNDTCRLGMKFIEMEKEQVGYVAEDPKITERMKGMFEEHLKSEKQFLNGHSYVIAEKLGLPPKYIRFCFNNFVQHKKNLKIWERGKSTQATVQFEDPRYTLGLNEDFEQSNDFSAESQQLLERTYLKMKPNGTRPVWTKGTISSLSTCCGVSTGKILKWLQHRQWEDDAAAPNKMEDWQRAVLLSTFSRISHPSRDEFELLAKSVKAPVTCVMQWFSYKQKGPKWHELPTNPSSDPVFLSEKNRSILLNFIKGKREVTGQEMLTLSKSFGVPVATVSKWLQSCIPEKQWTRNSQHPYTQ